MRRVVSLRLEDDLARIIPLVQIMDKLSFTEVMHKYLRLGLKNSKYAVIMEDTIPETEENKDDQDHDRRGP